MKKQNKTNAPSMERVQSKIIQIQRILEQGYQLKRTFNQKIVATSDKVTYGDAKKKVLPSFVKVPLSNWKRKELENQITVLQRRGMLPLFISSYHPSVPNRPPNQTRIGHFPKGINR